MEGRKWEEVPRDCLVDIFGRVGLESLLLDIPFVCKSWYQAILNPLCWKLLDFPEKYEPFFIRFQGKYRVKKEICFIKLVKGVVDRSAGCATFVKLPVFYGAEELSYVADKCPALKALVHHSLDLSTMLALPSVIGKFKNLEMLGITIRNECGSLFKDIVTQIGVHCQNFTAMRFVSAGVYPANCIGDDEVMTIVSCLPKLRALTLWGVRIERVNLIKLFKACVGLVHLDVRDCYGFDGNDKQLLKLASHISTFKSSGSVEYEYDYEEDHVDVDSDFDLGSD